jgi:hypothetical protein
MFPNLPQGERKNRITFLLLRLSTATLALQVFSRDPSLMSNDFAN